MKPRTPGLMATQTEASAGGGVAVRTLPFVGDDARLVEAARAGHPAALAALYDRYADHVDRVLTRVLGPERELDDLRHDVFVRILRAMRGLRNPASLGAWITLITVSTARTCIRRRKRRSWLWLWPGAEPPAPPVRPTAASECVEASLALRATYAALEALPADERIAFALRFIEGMELTEVAAACDVSLATIKRRLARAQRKFVVRAGADPVLREWIEGGRRWNRNEPTER